MATLYELIDGRAFLGFGVGATGPENIGTEPQELSQLEEDIRLLKVLLGGETVKIGGRDARCLFAAAKLPSYRHRGSNSNIHIRHFSAGWDIRAFKDLHRRLWRDPRVRTAYTYSIMTSSGPRVYPGREQASVPFRAPISRQPARATAARQWPSDPE